MQTPAGAGIRVTGLQPAATSLVQRAALEVSTVASTRSHDGSRPLGIDIDRPPIITVPDDGDHLKGTAAPVPSLTDAGGREPGFDLGELAVRQGDIEGSGRQVEVR